MKMSKRLLSCLMTILMLLSFVPFTKQNVKAVTTSMADSYYATCPSCSRTGYWNSNVVSPNCTDKGYTEVKCNYCGYSKKINYTNAVGHIWNPWIVEKVATVTSTGLKRHNCTVCGIVESEIIPISNHNHNYVLTKTVDSTCAKTGSKIFTCSVCKDSYTEEIAKKSHFYVRHEVQPTCTTDGYLYYTCEKCSLVASTSVVYPKTGHSFGAWVVVKAATETATGTMKRTCTICNAVETATIPKAEHNHVYRLSKTVNTSCTKEGSKTYVCSCGSSYTDIIPMKSHNYIRHEVAPTCTQDGYLYYTCKDCNLYANTSVVYPKTGHSYVRHTVDPDCTHDGYLYYTCSKCDLNAKTSVVYPAKGHSFGNWVIVTAATDLTTGTKKRTCSVCKAVETATIPKLVHTHSYMLTKTIDSTCAKEGSKTYTCKCGNCYTEVIEKKAHVYVRHDVASTCTEEGYTYYTCSNCDGSFSTSVKTPATGHSFGAWTITKAATATETGIKQRKCSKCGKVETQIIPKLSVDKTPVTLENHNISLDYKETAKLTVSKVNVEWSSSNPKVVTVDKNGNIKAVGTGTAEITVKDLENNTTDKCKITVSYTWWQWLIKIVLFGWLWY